MTTSSAIAEDLREYSRRAQELDRQLAEDAENLRLALQAFRDTHPDYGGNLDAIERRVRRLAAETGELDAWMGKVGDAFARADHGRHGAVVKVDDRRITSALGGRRKKPTRKNQAQRGGPAASGGGSGTHASGARPTDAHVPGNHADDLLIRGREVSGRFPTKAGPNEVLYRLDPKTGRFTYYEVYDDNGLPLYRVDLVGRAHGTLETPHVQEYTRNVDPKTGKVFVGKGEVRPATPDEVPVNEPLGASGSAGGDAVGDPGVGEDEGGGGDAGGGGFADSFLFWGVPAPSCSDPMWKDKLAKCNVA